MRELLRVTDQAPKDVRRGVRNELRAVAQPLRDDAQRRFLTEVSPDRAKSRYGISVRKAGTVSVEQRIKSKTRNPKLKRPKFTTLQWDRALGPAADKAQPEVEKAMEGVIEHLETKWLAR